MRGMRKSVRRCIVSFSFEPVSPRMLSLAPSLSTATSTSSSSSSFSPVWRPSDPQRRHRNAEGGVAGIASNGTGPIQYDGDFHKSLARNRSVVSVCLQFYIRSIHRIGYDYNSSHSIDHVTSLLPL